MNHDTLVNALLTLGFDFGWVVTDGVIELWENDKPQPTDAELIAAGWIKTESPEEAPEE